jgi:hypothetical protein
MDRHNTNLCSRNLVDLFYNTDTHLLWIRFCTIKRKKASYESYVVKSIKRIRDKVFVEYYAEHFRFKQHMFVLSLYDEYLQYDLWKLVFGEYANN